MQTRNLENLMITQNGIVPLCEMPSIDLFSSRINKKVSCYVSWRPYPKTQFVDAFSHFWSKGKFYAFPPFSLILCCLQKIEMDQWEGIMIVLDWPTQPWYPKLMCLLVNMPRLLPVTTETLYFPSKPSQQTETACLSITKKGILAEAAQVVEESNL